MKSKQRAKRKPGRPVVGLNRRPRNVQMTDQLYSLLQRAGKGRAADGLEIIVADYASRQPTTAAR